MGRQRWRTENPTVERLTCGCKIIWYPGSDITPGLLRCALHRSVSDLLAACKNLLNWSDRRYHGISVIAWQCTLCDGLSPDSGGPETIIHAKGCPVPQVEAAIAKAEPKESPDA